MFIDSIGFRFTSISSKEVLPRLEIMVGVTPDIGVEPVKVDNSIPFKRLPWRRDPDMVAYINSRGTPLDLSLSFFLLFLS